MTLCPNGFAYAFAGLTLALTTPRSGYAYRPFVSTDAAVAAPQSAELELGVVTLEHDQGANTFVIPAVVLNVGLLPRVELVGQFEVRNAEGLASIVSAPGVFLKGIVREGVLQNADGPSVAVEVGPTLPGGGADELGVGLESIAIASVAIGPVLAHVNAGGGLTRSSAAVGIWGVIGELPVGDGVRAVTELNGEASGGSRPTHQALVGCIWDAWALPLALDLGLRWGLNSAAPDWEVTAGLTVDVTL